jgi:hypothetical protein
MPKGHWIGSGQFLESIEKPLGNALKMPNSCLQPIGEKIELPGGYWEKRGNFHPFFLKCRVSVYID